MMMLLLGLRPVFFSVSLMFSSLLRPGVSRGGTGGGPLTRLSASLRYDCYNDFISWRIVRPSASLCRRDHGEDVPVPENIVHRKMERRPRVNPVEEALEEVGMNCLRQVLHSRTRGKKVDVGEN